jgi:uncharacterized protein (DUF58 family)
MRLTRAGLGLTATAAVLVIAGRFFGVLELFLLAGMALVALVVAVVSTATHQVRLDVHRTATPSRVRAGSTAQVDLVLQNRARRATPVLHLHDHVDGHGGATLNLAPIPGRGEGQVSYRLPTERRGPLGIGPLELGFGDALGLTSARLRAAVRTEVLVHATLVPLAPLRAGAGARAGADQQPRRSLAHSGDEFFALRPYVVGDELRRVHWGNSARTDQLLVRQEERARQGQVVVLLDLRRESYDDPGFERAVSAAVSALHAAWEGGDSVRFVTSNAGDSGPITRRSQLELIEDQLARIVPTPAASLLRAVEDVARGRGGGSLVVVTGQLSDPVLATIARARRSFGLVLVLSCQADPAPPDGVIVHDGQLDLATEWARQLHRPGTRPLASR